MEKRVYSLRETAEILGLSKSFIQKLVNQEKIPTVKIGARRLVPKEAIDELISYPKK